MPDFQPGGNSAGFGGTGWCAELGENPGPVPQHIPPFASREEEADFWDSHDITDYVSAADARVILPKDHDEII